MTLQNVQAISWEEKEGLLKGTVDAKYNATPLLKKEVKTMPIDIPNMKSKKETKKVEIVFPKKISDATKEELAADIKKMYPDFKVVVNKSILVETVFPSFEI